MENSLSVWLLFWKSCSPDSTALRKVFLMVWVTDIWKKRNLHQKKGQKWNNCIFLFKLKHLTELQSPFGTPWRPLGHTWPMWRCLVFPWSSTWPVQGSQQWHFEWSHRLHQDLKAKVIMEFNSTHHCSCWISSNPFICLLQSKARYWWRYLPCHTGALQAPSMFCGVVVFSQKQITSNFCLWLATEKVS